MDKAALLNFDAGRGRHRPGVDATVRLPLRPHRAPANVRHRHRRDSHVRLPVLRPAGHGEVRLRLLAIAASLIFHDMQYGPQATLIAERFGTNVRYSGCQPRLPARLGDGRRSGSADRGEDPRGHRLEHVDQLVHRRVLRDRHDHVVWMPLRRGCREGREVVKDLDDVAARRLVRVPATGGRARGSRALVTGGADEMGPLAYAGWRPTGCTSRWPTWTARRRTRSAQDIGGVAWQGKPRRTPRRWLTLSLDVDILVNNAGIQRILRCTTSRRSGSRRFLTLMVEAPFLWTRAALRACTSGGCGRTNNIPRCTGWGRRPSSRRTSPRSTD